MNKGVDSMNKTMEMYSPSHKKRVMAEVIEGYAQNGKGGSPRLALKGLFEGKKTLPKKVDVETFEKYGFNAEQTIAAFHAEQVGEPLPESPLENAPSTVPFPQEPSNANFSGEEEGVCPSCGGETYISTWENCIKCGKEWGAEDSPSPSGPSEEPEPAEATGSEPSNENFSAEFGLVKNKEYICSNDGKKYQRYKLAQNPRAYEGIMMPVCWGCGGSLIESRRPGEDWRVAHKSRTLGSAECEECGEDIENGKEVSGPYGETFCPICLRAILEVNPHFSAESAFDKLEDEVAEEYEEKGMSDEKAQKIGAAVAYTQGVKKYGKKVMTEAAKKGVSAKSLTKNAEDKPDYCVCAADPNYDDTDYTEAMDGSIKCLICGYEGETCEECLGIEGTLGCTCPNNPALNVKLDAESFNARGFESTKWRHKETGEIATVISLSDMKNWERVIPKNADSQSESLVEEPAWIPAGDGHIVGQQNFGINMSPLHAENEQPYKKCRGDDCEEIVESGSMTELCHICKGGWQDWVPEKSRTHPPQNAESQRDSFRTESNVITIWGVDYDTRIDEYNNTIIEDCGSSILANLEITSRFYEKYEGWYDSDNEFIYVDYDNNTQECSFSTTDLEVIVDLIDNNVHAIEELGYEALERKRWKAESQESMILEACGICDKAV